jgi:hypothetical protein
LARVQADGPRHQKTEQAANMKCELLLEWMTHLGTGSWLAFREAVSEILGGEDEPAIQISHLRSALSDLGHATFFVGDSNRWRVLRPALVRISGADEYLFVGGRTPRLLQKLLVAASSNGLSVRSEIAYPALSRVALIGSCEAAKSAADEAGLDYIPNLADRLIARLTPVRDQLANAETVEEPINWSVRSWSFEQAEWVSDRLGSTVREYSNRHGIKRYVVVCGEAKMRLLAKRESFYAAAFVAGVKCLRYDSNERKLMVPWWAPLPTLYARLASLTSGHLGSGSDGELIFRNIDRRIATTVSVGLGQGFAAVEGGRNG